MGPGSRLPATDRWHHPGIDRRGGAVALRFGLLGTGRWAAETHAPALVAAPGAELVAVWGRDAAKAGALAERYGARAYAEVDDLLAEVDAVAVALPPDVQAP